MAERERERRREKETEKKGERERKRERNRDTEIKRNGHNTGLPQPTRAPRNRFRGYVEIWHSSVTFTKVEEDLNATIAIRS